MALPLYEIVLIDGLKQSTRRGIVFLRQKGNEELNASDVCAGLSVKLFRTVRSRFDYWIDGGICDDYFHGFPNNQKYKLCLVFKWKVARQCQRMYGFLRHPLAHSNAAFQLCVLCSHATKNQWETDPDELGVALRLSSEPDALVAIKTAFPDAKPKAKQ